MSNKRFTPGIAAILAITATLSTVAAANHDDAEHLRDQVATLTAQRDAARADMAGQVEINAQYADQIADLTAERDKLTAAQSEPEPVPDTIPSGLRTWQGFPVGEVIVCPKGWDVSVDDADKPGWTFAACM